MRTKGTQEKPAARCELKERFKEKKTRTLKQGLRLEPSASRRRNAAAPVTTRERSANGRPQWQHLLAGRAATPVLRSTQPWPSPVAWVAMLAQRGHVSHSCSQRQNRGGSLPAAAEDEP